jgi:hypothetical protein
MGYTTEADDWEVQGVCQVGVGAGFAGGIWLFEFWSADADYDGFFIFAGLGLGLGGSLGGGGAPMKSIVRQLQGAKTNALQQHEDNFSTLECENKFSAAQLHMAAGRLTTAGGGAAIGYGLVYISAGAFPRKSLFLSQDVSGWGTGVGLNAATTVGLWRNFQ